MKVRRVVTGNDASGKSVIVSDMDMGPLVRWIGFEFHRVWGADAVSSLPDQGDEPAFSSYFPPIGGFRCWVFSIPPEGIAVPNLRSPRTALTLTPCCLG